VAVIPSVCFISEEHAMKNHPANSPSENAITATAWFSVLMHAHSKPDHEEATKALAELKRLGIVVKFQRGRQSWEGGCHEHE
jgi:hypothetical protein